MPMTAYFCAAKSTTEYTFKVDLRDHWTGGYVVADLTHRGIFPPLLKQAGDGEWVVAPECDWEVVVPTATVLKLHDHTHITATKSREITLTIDKDKLDNPLYLVPHKVGDDDGRAVVRLLGAYCQACWGTHERSDPCDLIKSSRCWNPTCNVIRGDTKAWHTHDCERDSPWYTGKKKEVCVVHKDLKDIVLGEGAPPVAMARLAAFQATVGGIKRPAGDEGEARMPKSPKPADLAAMEDL